MPETFTHVGASIGRVPEAQARLATALNNLTNRRTSLHDVALALQEKLAPVLRNTVSEQPKEPTGANAPCADSSVVMMVDTESRALIGIENRLVDLL